MEAFVAGAAAFLVVALVAAAWTPRRAAPRWAVGVAAVAGVAAWWAPGAPTGLPAYDAGLRVVVVAVAAWAAASCPALLLAASGAAAAVAAGGSPWASVAGAAAGVAIAAAATRLDLAWLRAAAGGAVALAALHLERPQGTGQTTVVALLVVGIPTVVGLARLPRRARRLAFSALAALVILAGGAAAAGAVAVVGARDDVEAGVAAARRGLAAAERGQSGAAGEALDAAHASFSDVRRHVDVWWARPALLVPVAAQHVRAVSTASATGARVASVGADALAVSDVSAFGVRDGRVDLAALGSLEASATRAHAVLADATDDIAAVGSPWLVPPVTERLDDLGGRVARARDQAGRLGTATDVVGRMLGRDGPRRYFVAVQTPSEARAAGGFLGNFAEISATDGRLVLERVGRTADLNTGGGPRTLRAPPDYLERYSRFDPHLLWQNVNMSPDFPTVAAVMADLYPQSGGPPVDGVFAIDPHGLAAMLRVIGPVTVARWPVPITTDNAVPILLHEQYVRLQGDARELFLSEVTAAVWQRLTTRASSAVELTRALGTAVAEGHMMAAATRADEQAALLDLGIAGAMAPVEDDFLAVVTQNASGNKIDWFLRRKVDYRVQLDAGGNQVSAEARVTLTNGAPARGLPPYVIGSALKPPLPSGMNRTYLSVYSPWALTGATVGERPTSVESHVELGRNVYSAFVDVPPGGSTEVVFRLRGRRSGEGGSYVLDVHRQPVVGPDALRVTVAGGAGAGAAACGPAGCGPERVAELELLRDRRLSWRLVER